MPNSEASTWGRIGSHVSWANTKDRTARTAPARAALEQKFLDQADGDPVRAEHLRKAHFQRLAMKSAAARRAKKLEAAAPARRAREYARLDEVADPTGETAARYVDRERGGSHAA
jgi:hypothetical protein